MKKTLLLCALFAASFSALRAQVVITELMYNPPGADTLLEYLEIHNAGGAAVDVSGWTFEGITFTFPSGTSMSSKAFFVVCANASVPNLQLLGVTNPFRWTNSALTNTGEKITLKDASGAIVDEVDYKAVAPWPAAANNTGASLVLCDPSKDNSDPANWSAATTPSAVVVGGVTALANPGQSCNAVPPVITYPARSIAGMTTENANGAADSLNRTCELTGTVYGVNLRASATGAQFTLADDAGVGITVFSSVKNFGYTVNEKDKVTVRGRIAQFNGLTQINADTLYQVGGNAVLVSPSVVAKLGENTESRLVKITGLSLVNPAAWAPAGTGFTVRAVSAANPTDTIDIRIDNDVELFNLPVPPQPFDVTGIGGQFDNSNPFTSGYQLLPRYRNDISTLVNTHTADFSADVRLSPNPVKDVLTVQCQTNFDRIRVFSADGRLVRTLENPALTEQLSVQTWASGTYFFQFEKAGAVWTTRVVK